MARFTKFLQPPQPDPAEQDPLFREPLPPRIVIPPPRPSARHGSERPLRSLKRQLLPHLRFSLFLVVLSLGVAFLLVRVVAVLPK